jgi:hypothetical protein
MPPPSLAEIDQPKAFIRRVSRILLRRSAGPIAQDLYGMRGAKRRGREIKKLARSEVRALPSRPCLRLFGALFSQAQFPQNLPIAFSKRFNTGFSGFQRRFKRFGLTQSAYRETARNPPAVWSIPICKPKRSVCIVSIVSRDPWNFGSRIFPNFETAPQSKQFLVELAVLACELFGGASRFFGRPIFGIRKVSEISNASKAEPRLPSRALIQPPIYPEAVFDLGHPASARLGHVTLSLGGTVRHH